MPTFFPEYAPWQEPLLDSRGWATSQSRQENDYDKEALNGDIRIVERNSKLCQEPRPPVIHGSDPG